MTILVNEMTAQGYKIQNVAGRTVLVRYFAEYDETFLCPAVGSRGRWNAGKAYEGWLGVLNTKFDNRLVKASFDRVAIKGCI